MLRRAPLGQFASNVLSLIGVILVTTAGVSWLLTFPAYWRGEAGTAYIGILLFLILPGLFLLGLLLIDLAMTAGSISPKLPFIKEEAVEVLRRDYPDREAASREIAAAIENFCRTSYPQTYAADWALIKTAVNTVESLYAQNIFPEMKVTWSTYPNHLGHTDYPGCFRCHDGNHTSADGRTISNDCPTCHDLLAVSEKNPKILTEGMNPSPPLSTGGATK
jgi:hypothetical protein